MVCNFPLQGAAGSPMDMDTPFFPGSSQATAASPLQQPKFTPSWKTSPTAAGTSSAFKAGQDEAAPRQAAPSGQSSFMFSSTFEPSATPDPQGPVIDDDNDDPQSGANNQHQMPAQPNQQPKSHTHTTQPMGAKAAANPFPFFAANRPMDSRIPEACANSFMGIHLSNSPPKPFAATAPAAEPVTQAASHAQTAAGCTVNFAQGAPSDPTRPDATAAAADSSHAAPPSFSFGTGFAKSTAQTGAAEAPSAKASAAFAFGAGATSQSANVSFTPGVQRASKQTPKDRTSRIIHDPFQLHGNIRTQLNLEDQFTAQAPAATRSSEPVIDLTKAHRTQRQSTHSRSSASAQPAQPSGQTQESASSQTSQAPFVFGSGKPAGPTHFASTAASGTNATSSQAQSQKPFVFGATSNAPAPAAFPTAFGAQPQQPNQPKASWPPQPAVPPRKPSMFSSATAVPGPQPGTASTQQSAHASGKTHTHVTS